MKRLLLIAGLSSLLSQPAFAGSPIDCGIAGNPSCRTMIGKKIWIAGVNTSVCPSPNVSNSCKGTAKGGYVVRDVVDNGHYTTFFVVNLPDGSTGYIDTTESFKLSTTDPAEDARLLTEAATKAAQECDRRGQPKVGMGASELVETCWRAPARIVKRTTAAGVEENYIYGYGHAVKLVDGKVSEIIEAR